MVTEDLAGALERPRLKFMRFPGGVRAEKGYKGVDIDAVKVLR